MVKDGATVVTSVLAVSTRVEELEKSMALLEPEAEPKISGAGTDAGLGVTAMELLGVGVAPEVDGE